MRSALRSRPHHQHQQAVLGHACGVPKVGHMCSYSLIRPPRTGRRCVEVQPGSAMGRQVVVARVAVLGGAVVVVGRVTVQNGP